MQDIFHDISDHGNLESIEINHIYMHEYMKEDT